MTVSGHRHQLEGFEGESVEAVRSNGKRIFSPRFKAALVRHCRRTGVSVAAAALAHGINANLLRRWITLSAQVEPSPSARLVPVDVQVAMIAAPEAFPVPRSAAPVKAMPGGRLHRNRSPRRARQASRRSRRARTRRRARCPGAPSDDGGAVTAVLGSAAQ